MPIRRLEFPSRRRRVRRKCHSQYLLLPPLHDPDCNGHATRDGMPYETDNGKCASTLQSVALQEVESTDQAENLKVLRSPASSQSIESGTNSPEILSECEFGEDPIEHHLVDDSTYNEDEGKAGDMEVVLNDPEGSKMFNSTGTGKLKSTDIFRLLTEGETLAALFSTIGTRRFAVWQHKIVRRRINFHADGSIKRGVYPSYCKIQQTIIPLMRKQIYVSSKTVTMEVNVNRAGAPGLMREQNGQVFKPRREVRIVPISSWGKSDLSERRSRTEDTVGGCGGGAASIGYRLFDSIKDAAITSNRLAILSSSCIYTTENIGDLIVPMSMLTEGCIIDVWLGLRRHEVLGPLQMFATQNATNTSNLVIRGIKCGRSWVIREASILFDAADVVMELQPPAPGFNSSAEKLYIVHKMNRTEDVPTIHVLYKQENGGFNASKRVRCVKITLSMALPNLSTALLPSALHSGAPSLPRCGTTGILQDGQEYVVYRFFIFADDFSSFAQVSRKGSAGGCYLLPVGIPISGRTGVHGIRVVSMTPPGVSTGQVIISLIPDIIKGTVEGFKIVTDDGKELIMFIDMVGYQCDYFAIQEDSDLRGHQSIAPCNLCTFQRGDRNGTETSMYAYTTSIHSANAAFRRDAMRMDAIRTKFKTEEELQSVGLRNMEASERKNLPLQALSSALRQVRDKVPRNLHGEPVVPASFDPYLSTVIAPDHLFSNLIKDVLNSNIKALRQSRSARQRSCLHALARDALRKHGIQTESQYLNEQDGSLHVMSMSALFKLIMVGPWALAMARTLDHKGSIDFRRYVAVDLVELAFQLKDLIADTTFYAKVDRDGRKLAEKFTPHGWKSRERRLMIQAMRYVSALDKCCSKSEIVAKELDKPNVHRLVELYVHTIPTFGHIRLYQELSLERNHQPLKRALSNSNHKSAQLQVMDHILGDDWKSRLKAAAGGALMPKDLSDTALKDLQRALTGDGTSLPLQGDLLRKVFDKSLLADLKEFSSRTSDSSDVSSKASKWISSGEYVLYSRSDPFCVLNERAKKTIESYINSINPCSEARVYSLLRACQVKEGTDARKKPHRDRFLENIRVGDILQGAVFKSDIHHGHHDWSTLDWLLVSDNENADVNRSIVNEEPSYWYVTGLMEVENCLQVSGYACAVMATALALHKSETQHCLDTNREARIETSAKNFPPIYTLENMDTSSGYVLPLYPGVMKVMRLHACTGKCMFDVSNDMVIHKESANEDAAWIIYGSVQGFPPRSA